MEDAIIQDDVPPVMIQDAEPVETEVKPQQNERLSRGYAELAKKEAAIREKTRHLREQESRLEEYQTLVENAKKDPRAVIQKLGIDPLTLADMILGQKKEDAAPPLPEVEALKKELSELKSYQQRMEHERLTASELGRIQGVISSNPEKYELLSAFHKSGHDVPRALLEEAAKEYKETGVVPDYSTLAQRAEKEYYEQLTQNVDSLLSVGKIKTYIAQKLGGLEKPVSNDMMEQAVLKTLSSSMESTPKQQMRKMTEEEREAEFIKIMNEKGWNP